VTTDGTGSFSITGDYQCALGAQLYLLAMGGNPGLSGAQTNSALSMMTGVGACPSGGSLQSSVPFIAINEVTTVATAYALAGFMTDATHLSAPYRSQARTGLATAFQNIPNIVDIPSGTALSHIPLAPYNTTPQTTINTLANLLSSCVNSTGPASTGCAMLFASTADGSAPPTDTASAMLRIAHHPTTNVATLFNLQLPTSPFQPNLSAAPSGFVLPVNVYDSVSGNVPQSALAIDASGNVWTTTTGSAFVAEINGNGAPVHGSPFFTIYNFAANSLAIDGSG
jgi:hypothetical protein